MASYKFLVVLTLFVTCLSLANSAPFSSGRDWAQTETVIPNDETDAKEPEQYGGGYNSGQCKYGCCYRGRFGCIRCCRYPNEEPNSVETSKRGRGGCKYGCCGSYAYGQCSACYSRTQVAEEANEQKVSPIWAQNQP